MIITNLRCIDSPKGGEIRLIPHSGDDIWVIYNIIEVGDLVTAKTHRKIAGDKMYTVKLTIGIEKIFYVGEDDQINVSGQIRSENPVAPLGSYHTLILKPKLPCSVNKSSWDVYQKKLLRESINDNADVTAAVMMISKGTCALYGVNHATPRLKGSVNLSIPKNRRLYSKYQQGMEKFFLRCANIISGLLSTLNTLVVAGPGLTKTEFITWMDDTCKKDAGATPFYKSLGNFLNEYPPIVIKCATANGGISLENILASKALKKAVVDSRLENQINAMRQFQRVLSDTPDKACYGVSSIEYAIDLRAANLLIVSDLYYRSPVPATRRRFTACVENALSTNVNVVIAYRGHQTYDSVSAMGGFAATLKWEIPEDEYPPIENIEKEV